MRKLIKFLCGPELRLLIGDVRTFGQPVIGKKQITKQSMGMRENERPGHGEFILTPRPLGSARSRIGDPRQNQNQIEMKVRDLVSGIFDWWKIEVCAITGI